MLLFRGVSRRWNGWVMISWYAFLHGFAISQGGQHQAKASQKSPQEKTPAGFTICCPDLPGGSFASLENNNIFTLWSSDMGNRPSRKSAGIPASSARAMLVFMLFAAARVAVISSQAKKRQALWLSSSFKMFSCAKIAIVWASRRFGSLMRMSSKTVANKANYFHCILWPVIFFPFRELTYPLYQGSFEDEFPFLKWHLNSKKKSRPYFLGKVFPHQMNQPRDVLNKVKRIFFHLLVFSQPPTVSGKSWRDLHVWRRRNDSKGMPKAGWWKLPPKNGWRRLDGLTRRLKALGLSKQISIPCPPIQKKHLH